MLAYKLTDKNMQTYNSTQWQIGEWKETDRSGDLCSSGWLHYYSDPLLAVFLNPIHADIATPRLFEVEVSGDIKEDRGLKFGCTNMRLVRELQLPAVTDEQKIKFAIYCALEVCQDTAFVKWAKAWLDGTDRSYDAAAGRAAEAAAGAAAWAAEAAAADAVRAADAAYCATRAAAEAARAANVTYYAAYAGAGAGAGAAYYAAAAGGAATRAAKERLIDLIAIAQKAME